MRHNDLSDEANSQPVNSPGHEPSRLSFPVVGLGASAGGIEALSRFFTHMPSDSGMAFVVILHLSPKHESNVDQILGRVTRMPVMQVDTSVPIEKNHIYVISPALHLEMSDGHLNVSPAKRPRERQIAIDLFFRTLADVHQSRAFAIVLSGTGSDGSVGMARIREQGGVALAQLPDDADFDGMPRSVIESEAVDFVLPVSDMPQKLIDLWQNAQRIELPEADKRPDPSQLPTSEEKERAAEEALSAILKLLSSRSGHDFKHYKRATVLRRIERRLQVTSMADLPNYFSFLQQHPNETEALLGDMLIGVTNFFRDREAFESLERDILPTIVQWAESQQHEGLRAWTAACSTGEEAYSLAIILAAEVATQKSSIKTQVFATDIDERAIMTARRALYPISIVTDVPPVYLRQYFTAEGDRYRIAKTVRECVLFAQHNLLHDPPFSRLHLITCRNLLIYLDRRAQREVLQIFHSALRPGGYLFLGMSETTDTADDLFTIVDKKNRIYRASATAALQRPWPVKDSAVTLMSRPVMRHQPPTNKRHSYSGAHQRAMEQYGPATILVDNDFQIVHMSDSASAYLRHVGGDPSHNLLVLAHPKLRVELRTAVLRALKSGNGAESRPVALKRDGKDLYIKISARAFNDEDRGTLLVLLIFNETTAATESLPDSSLGKAKDQVLETLEDEVQTLTEQLHQTVEHSNTSTEDLRASNEELQAMNEELRSATEELETSKEELQSINEELITVNHELKARVEETAKINDDLQNLISSNDIATVFVDRSLRIKWFTPKASTLFNLLAVDTGRSLMDITHKLDYPGMMADASLTFESLRLIEREVQSADNRWYLARILPYRTVADHIDGAVLNFVDITERRQAEDRLRQGLERLRLVAEGTRDFAIITMDENGHITGWNRAAEIIFGYEAAEVQGKSPDFIFTPEDRARGKPAEELKLAREEGHACDDRWHMRKDGSRFFCSGVVHPLVDGSLIGYAKIARDLTDKRIEDYEQELHLERSKASNVLKDEFIAIMSHELRHPLNLIQLNMDLLARAPGVGGSPNAEKAIASVRRAVRSQSKLIEDLLDLSRARTGKLKLQRDLVRLDACAAAIIAAIEPETAAGELTLYTEGLDNSQADAFVIDGDATRIEQVIWNLLNNAIKFTPPGGSITVALSQEGKEARLDISDTGAGIATQHLDSIFKMFTQIERSHSDQRSRGGLGIGLALVSQLVQAHGGRTAARSAGEGQGSTFSVWLPLASSPAVTAEESETSDRAGRIPRLQGMRLLLVDDAPEICEMLAELCQFEGATVSTASDGKEALKRLREADFDVLVSDLGMPGIDGYTLLSTLRKSSRNANIPAIALTGYGHSMKAQAVGYSDQLCKPVPMDELLDKLCAIVENRRP